jgi:hypothetical protein
MLAPIELAVEGMNENRQPRSPDGSRLRGAALLLAIYRLATWRKVSRHGLGGHAAQRFSTGPSSIHSH